MMRHSVIPTLIIGLSITLSGVPAQPTSPPKEKRLVYLVKYGVAKDLAGSLGKHFKGEAGVQVLSDSPSNCLLINAPSATFDEIIKLLDQLDRRPQQVFVEVPIAEAAVTKEEGGKPDQPASQLDEREFTGGINDVLTKVEALQKKGLIGGLKRLQMTTVENQPASMYIGERKPIVTGSQIKMGGKVGQSISYVPVRTSARLTLRIVPPSTIVMDLKVEDSRTHVPEDGPQIGTDEKGVPIRATEVISAMLDARLTIPSGRALAAQGVKTTSKSGRAQTLVVVGARVVEFDAKAIK